jgi:DNA-binding NarL/FixJ family response regulator
MRQSLRAFIKRQADLDICGEADTGEAALEQIAQMQPDLVLIDVSLPGMSGLDLLDTLHERYPDLACVMLSGHGERSHVDHALMAGARGYVLKGDIDDLVVALHRVIQGEIYLSGMAQDKLSGGTDEG